MRIIDWSSDVCSSDLAQVRQQLDRAVRAARQQDPQVDTATYVRAGGFDQILSQSIVAEAISQWAEKHGFGVSRRQVDAEIASIPAFQIGGRFDQASYEARSEEHTSELQSLMRTSYAVFCLKKKKTTYKSRHTS